jgi:hypothetical protein
VNVTVCLVVLPVRFAGVVNVERDRLSGYRCRWSVRHARIGDLSQRLSQRARLEELGRTERLRHADQETAEKKSKTDQLRSCYVQLNANDRNYRDAMQAYAYALRADHPPRPRRRN